MKRNTLGIVATFTGSFLCVMALVTMAWVPGILSAVAVGETSVTRLAGTLYDAEPGPARGEPVPVRAVVTVRSDPAREDSGVAVLTSTTCLIRQVPGAETPDCAAADDPDDALAGLWFDVYALDRRTAMAVNDPRHLPADASYHRGLVSRWPAAAEPRRRPLATASGPAEAVPTGRVRIEGTPVDRYRVDGPEADARSADDPTLRFRDRRTVWVEPATGRIVQESILRSYTRAGGEAAGSLRLRTTDEQVSTSLREAARETRRRTLVTRRLPVIALAVGIPLLLVGLWLCVASARRADGA